MTFCKRCNVLGELAGSANRIGIWRQCICQYGMVTYVETIGASANSGRSNKKFAGEESVDMVEELENVEMWGCENVEMPARRSFSGGGWKCENIAE
jgi:hypothetical protein